MIGIPAFVDMKKTPAEIAEDKADMCVPTSYPQDIYPWGLCISLDEESLAKLNLEDTPDAGDHLLMVCLAKVTSASKRDTTDGVKARVELQIEQIAIEGSDEDVEETPRKSKLGTMYKG